MAMGHALDTFELVFIKIFLFNLPQQPFCSELSADRLHSYSLLLSVDINLAFPSINLYLAFLDPQM